MVFRHWLSAALRASPSRGSHALRSFSSTRCAHDITLPRVNYEEKYAEKLQRRAQEQGKSVADLRAELKEQERQRRLQKLKEESSKGPQLAQSSPASAPSSSAASSVSTSSGSSSRKDSSPVKPLSSILNLDKLLEKPHTPEQISLLWRAYHESRTGGTGRGFLCATVPVESYDKMLEVSAKYPTFILPVPRENAQVEEGSKKPAYEFYLMEWGFHGSPPEPATTSDLFSPTKASSNPQTSTILFTPLQEYKLRQSFATPYLVLTHYTDLAKSHGLVLLRGEITPSGASAGVGAGEDGMRYMLSQQDAQLLAIHVQRFYLQHEGSEERAALLKTFHEAPEQFKWEKLLVHTDFSA
ncbi:ATP11-domain-containing protein [Dichomitus squalens]|uniref:ATP11-domain-containing protein n=1 Tax=Dichomitus squalens TaxID=114155 RepID=A0A4Q9QBV5_9APHY|nr:ATP11-domain-containing protein [Dichomitus squalens]TBU64646.1 ATP11-domain-containing protein [Dichomitus squalens]